MGSCIAGKDIGGFCVGEPFHTKSVRDSNGVILAESADLSPMHPEKALIVSNDFDEFSRETHLEVIRAVAEAASLCETHDGREETVEILARPHYLGIDPDLLRSSLFAGEPNEHGEVTSKNFHIFSHPEVNRPPSDKANWLVSHMRNSGLLDQVDIKEGPPLSEIFREDIFEEATNLTTAAA